MSGMLMRPFVLAGLVALLAAGTSMAQDEAQARRQALKEFRTAEKTLDKLYHKCPDCKGRGKVKERTCRKCEGAGKLFDGDYQILIDNYLAYCDLMEKHDALLADDKKLGDRIRANQSLYLRTIRSQTGPQKTRKRVMRGGEAHYTRGEKVDGEYNKLARKLTGVTKESPVGHGIAFEGNVLRILTADERSLAEVRIQTVSFASRICYVLVPPDVRWAEDVKVRVIGKILDGAAERKAFELDGQAVVVTPYHGTE
ncbi:MAG: hypothetical protein KAY37_09725 [Phycisphaerae bacterium]|nr:hypothetical protein [Phycisphaerae bacterium]